MGEINFIPDDLHNTSCDSSSGGALKTGFISGSWLSEPWTAKVVTDQAWPVFSPLDSLAGLGGCFVLKRGEREKLKAE